MEGDKDEQSSTLPEEQQQAQKTPEKSTVTTAVGEETTPTKTATPTTSTPAVVSPPTSAAISVSRVNVAPSVNDSNNKNSNDVEVGNSVLEPAVGHTAAGSTRERDVEVDTLTESHPSSAENTRLQRKWEFFPGKNHFYCDGRVMTAPSIRFCMLSFALILLTFVLFIIFDAPFLTERLSVAIPIVGSILFVSVIVNMIKTSFSDPGILPRASQQEADYLEKSYYNTVQRPPPRTKDIIVNGQVIKSKYCFTCKMFRPPRASHCSVCDNCVDRFDHHCPFLGNCIGKRNYRSFYTFIVSLSFLAVFVLSASIAHLAMLSKERGNFLEALRDSPGSAVVIIISFFGMWTVLGLSGFHTYLIAVEQTTNEDIKGLFGRANAKNPFSQGNFCQNCCFVLCGPSQPSLIDPRGFATPEFIAALPRKGDPNGMLSSGQIPQQNMVKPNPTINNCSNDQQHGPGPSVSYVGVTSGGANFYREHPPPAAPNMVQPIQHQPLHMSTSQSSTSELNNGGLIKSGFPSLPSIPPEEKILIKGQTRNGRPADFRQTIPGKSTPRESVTFSTLSSTGSVLISSSSGVATRPRTQVTLGQIGRQSSAPAAPIPPNDPKMSYAPTTILMSNNPSNNISKVRPHSLAGAAVVGERRYSISEKDKFYAKSNSVSNFRTVSASPSMHGMGLHQQHHHHPQHHPLYQMHPHEPPPHYHHPVQQQHPLQYPHVVGNSRPVIGGRMPVKSSSLILDKGEFGGGAVGRVPSTLPTNVLNNNFKNIGGNNNNFIRRPFKMRDSPSAKLLSGASSKEMLIPSGGGCAAPPPRVHHSLDRNVYRNSYRSPAEMQAKMHKGRVVSGHASDTGMVIASAQRAMRRRSLAAVEVEGLIKV